MNLVRVFRIERQAFLTKNSISCTGSVWCVYSLTYSSHFDKKTCLWHHLAVFLFPYGHLIFMLTISPYCLRKVKLSPSQATEAYRVVRCRGSHIV
jgi:hypothetical protein